MNRRSNQFLADTRFPSNQHGCTRRRRHRHLFIDVSNHITLADDFDFPAQLFLQHFDLSLRPPQRTIQFSADTQIAQRLGKNLRDGQNEFQIPRRKSGLADRRQQMQHSQKIFFAIPDRGQNHADRVNFALAIFRR